MRPGDCREVKSGGAVYQKVAGTMPSGKPSLGNRTKSEYDQASAGTVSGGLGKGRSEYGQKSAGK